MNDKINAIITGGGAPGIAGTIYALRNNPEKTIFKIITTDINDDVVGKYLAEKFYRVPQPESKEYIHVIKNIAVKEKVDVILPQTTREILILSKNIDEFSKLGIEIVSSSYNSIKIAYDKFLLLKKAKKIRVPYPNYYLTNSKNSLNNALKFFGYPKNKVVVKPRTSDGSRGFRVLTEKEWDVQRFLSEKPEGIEINKSKLLKILSKGSWPELLVMEYLPGEEYTVDIFRGKNGIVIIPRLREKLRSGITFDAKVEYREDIIKFSEKLSVALNMKYCFGFQFKLSEEGVPKILECNPRIQGTMVTSVFAGFNMIYYSVMEALKKEVEVNNFVPKNIKFKRYWGGVGIDGEKFIDKI